MNEDDAFKNIEREFATLGYEVDVTKSNKGWWLAAYRPKHQEQGTTEAFEGRSPLQAAEAAQAGLRKELASRGN